MLTYKRILHQFVNSFFLERPLLYTSSLILVKVLLELEDFNLVSGLIIGSVLFQNIIYVKKQWLLKLIKKRTYIPHLLAFTTYLMSLFSVNYQGSQIFVGLEIAIVFIANLNEISKFYYRVLFLLSLIIFNLKKEELNLLYIIHYLFVIYLFDRLSKNFRVIDVSYQAKDIQQTKNVKEKSEYISLHIKGKCKINQQEELIQTKDTTLSGINENLINLIDFGVILID